MKTYSLAIFLAAFLQGVSHLFWWPALVVVWAAGRHEAKGVYFLAFGGGLLTDLVSQKFLGVTAIYLLILALIVGLFRARFEISTRSLLVILVVSQILWKLTLNLGF